LRHPALSVDVARNGLRSAAIALHRVLTIVAYLVGTMARAVFGAQLEHGGEQPNGRDRHAASVGLIDIRRRLGFERRWLPACGALGACLAWLIFDGQVMSTSGAGATQLAVPLVVGPRIIVLGILWACVIGMIGACLPAAHAARTPLVAALRGS
jgi:putative ABC transport system permease protein